MSAVQMVRALKGKRAAAKPLSKKDLRRTSRGPQTSGDRSNCDCCDCADCSCDCKC